MAYYEIKNPKGVWKKVLHYPHEKRRKGTTMVWYFLPSSPFSTNIFTSSGKNSKEKRKTCSSIVSFLSYFFIIFQRLQKTQEMKRRDDHGLISFLYNFFPFLFIPLQHPRRKSKYRHTRSTTLSLMSFLTYLSSHLQSPQEKLEKQRKEGKKCDASSRTLRG